MGFVIDMLLLLLFVVSISAIDVTRCDGASDSQALRRHLDHLPVPKTHFHWAQLDTLDISVVLPYSPSAFRYALSFDPPTRYHSENRCSSNWDPLSDNNRDKESDFDTSDDISSSDQPANLWSFAPNANFPRAFSDRLKYPANFVSNSSIWRASAIDCAHVRYTTTINLDQLVKCNDTMASIKLDSGAHALIGTLFIAGFAEYSDKPVYDYRYHITIYSDAHGNAAMLVYSGFDIVIRSVEANVDSLNLRMQTTNLGGALSLDSVTPRISDGLELLPMHVHLADSYKSQLNETLQNWDATVQSEGLTYNGQYTLLFNNGKNHNDPYIADLFIRVDNAPAATDAQLAAVHGSIAQHRPGDLESHQGVFKNGERVCMQSYVRLPGELEDHSEIEIVDAALCPDDGSVDIDKFSCFDHTHGLVLLEKGEPALEDVEIVWPGAYGASSAALCFTASVFLVDNSGATIMKRQQRYEARVVVHAHNSAARQASVAWRRARSDDDAFPKHLVSRAHVTKAQFSLQNSAFSNGDLERSLIEARVRSQLTEHEEQVYAFLVERDETMAHGISATEATVLIVVIVFILVAVGLCWWVSVLYTQSRTSMDDPVALASRISSAYTNPNIVKQTAK